MTGAVLLDMEPSKCPHKLMLNKTESVIGIKRVNAVVDCFYCNKRIIPGRIMLLDQFDRDFDKKGNVRTYWLKRSEYPA